MEMDGPQGGGYSGYVPRQYGDSRVRDQNLRESPDFVKGIV
jgi:hypothetical protein